MGAWCPPLVPPLGRFRKWVSGGHFLLPSVAPATHESSGVRAWPGCNDRRGAARTAADFARQASPVRPARFAAGRGGITATTGAILAACRWLYNKALLDHDSPAAGGQPRGRWQAAPSPVGPGVLRGRPSLFDGPTQWPCVRREEAGGCPPFDVSRPEGWGRGLGAGFPRTTPMRMAASRVGGGTRRRERPWRPNRTPSLGGGPARSCAAAVAEGPPPFLPREEQRAEPRSGGGRVPPGAARRGRHPRTARITSYTAPYTNNNNRFRTADIAIAMLSRSKSLLLSQSPSPLPSLLPSLLP